MAFVMSGRLSGLICLLFSEGEIIFQSIENKQAQKRRHIAPFLFENENVIFCQPSSAWLFQLTAGANKRGKPSSPT